MAISVYRGHRALAPSLSATCNALPRLQVPAVFLIAMRHTKGVEDARELAGGGTWRPSCAYSLDVTTRQRSFVRHFFLVTLIFGTCARLAFPFGSAKGGANALLDRGTPVFVVIERD